MITKPFDHYKQGIAMHRCCAIFYPERQQLFLERSLTGSVHSRHMEQIKHEGLYFFGGRKGPNHESCNILAIL